MALRDWAIRYGLCAWIALLLGLFAACRSAVRVVRSIDPSAERGTVYYLPQHSMELRFTMAVRQTIPGPYAEYAEELLGITSAPQRDGVEYIMAGVELTTRIEPDLDYAFSVRGRDSVAMLQLSRQGHLFPANAALGLHDAGRQLHRTRGENRYTDLALSPFVGRQENTFYQVLQNDTAFVRVPVQRSVNVRIPRDEKAKQAAEFIFTLRKKRYDLVAGDVDLAHAPQGTLPAMLDEIARLEESYLQLFVGRMQVDTIVRSVTFVPSVGTSVVIPCRFSPARGIVSPREMDARPVVVTCAPEREVIDSGRGTRPLVNALYYRPAVPVGYTVSCDHTQWLSGRLFLYQYGEVIPMSNPKQGRRGQSAAGCPPYCP